MDISEEQSGDSNFIEDPEEDPLKNEHATSQEIVSKVIHLDSDEETISYSPTKKFKKATIVATGASCSSSQKPPNIVTDNAKRFKKRDSLLFLKQYLTKKQRKSTTNEQIIDPSGFPCINQYIKNKSYIETSSSTKKNEYMKEVPTNTPLDIPKPQIRVKDFASETQVLTLKDQQTNQNPTVTTSIPQSVATIGKKGAVQNCASDKSELELINNKRVMMYGCTLCLLAFDNLDSLQAHLAVHSPQDMNPTSVFQCVHCSFKGHNLEYMKNHTCPNLVTNNDGKMEENAQIYFCVVCSFKADNLNVLKSHVCVPNNETANKKILCCVLCSYQTDDLNHLNSHVCPSRTINIPNSTSPLKNYLCSKCSFLTDNFENLNSHLAACTANSSSSPIPNTVKTKFRCIRCKYSSDNLSDVKQHVCSAKPVPSARYCPICSFKTTDMRLFNSHQCANSSVPSSVPSIQISKKPKFSCSNCLYMTSDLPMLRTHVCSRRKNSCSFYVCTQCNFVPKSVKALNTHKCSTFINEHKNKTEAVSSATSSALSGAKFSCLACPFSTSDIKVANTHKCYNMSKKNDADRASQLQSTDCDICGQSCPSSTEMCDHVMKNHFAIKKLWVCGFCKSPTFFFSLKVLMQHNKIIHNISNIQSFEIRYQCTFCTLILEELQVKEHFGTHIREHIRMIDSIKLQDNFVDYFSKIQNNQCSLDDNDKRKECLLCFEHNDGELIQCQNVDCEFWYHLKCCNNLSEPRRTKGIVNEISKNPYWYCIRCSTKQLSSIREDIASLTLAVERAEKKILDEDVVHKYFNSEMKRIKSDNLATVDEFSRVKRFLINSKSEKINNCIVRGVCNVIDKFLNAGTDNMFDEDVYS